MSLMDYYSPRANGCRIRQFAHRGHDLLSMENSLLRITLLLDKGADIIEFIYKPMDLDFMWKSAEGLGESAKLIDAAAQVSGAYFDYYPGGWQEILPGGGPMNYLGAEVGLHGELSLRPWEFSVDEDTAARISVTLKAKTKRFPFAVKKTITMEDPPAGETPLKSALSVRFHEMLLNEGRQTVEYMWAQHPCFGPPFIEPGCVFNIPAKKMMSSPGFHTDSMIFPAGFEAPWPYTGEGGDKITNVQKKNSGYTGFYHFSQLSEGRVSLFNKNKKIGFALEWDKEVFPYVTSWQDYNGSMDYPWYGGGYNATLEIWNTPTDNFATAKKIAHIPVLKAGESAAVSYTAAAITDE